MCGDPNCRARRGDSSHPIDEISVVLSSKRRNGPAARIHGVAGRALRREILLSLRMKARITLGEPLGGTLRQVGGQIVRGSKRRCCGVAKRPAHGRAAAFVAENSRFVLAGTRNAARRATARLQTQLANPAGIDVTKHRRADSRANGFMSSFLCEPDN